MSAPDRLHTWPGTRPHHLAFSPHIQEQQETGQKHGTRGCGAGSEPWSLSLSASPEQDCAKNTIIRPFLEAIDAGKAAVIVSIHYLATECTLIRHDLDKIRGRLTVAEDRISDVEDTSHSHGNQLSELYYYVKTLIM